MPQLRVDARSARKLRRPAALPVAATSSCGKNNACGVPPVEEVASRKNDFFTLGEYASLDF